MPDPIGRAWKEANGVELKPNYIGNHDDIQAKILAGGGSYDLITYYQGYKVLYDELGIMHADRYSKIPNIENEYPIFKEPDQYNLWIDQDGTWTGVPWTWGAIGITWNDAGAARWPRLLVRPTRPQVQGEGRHRRRSTGLHTLGSHVLG